jgi:hypothetical protein
MLLNSRIIKHNYDNLAEDRTSVSHLSSDL